MPMYKIADTNIDVCREAILVDTNVLVCCFSPNEAGGLREHLVNLVPYRGRTTVTDTYCRDKLRLWASFHSEKVTDATAVLGLLEWLEAPGESNIGTDLEVVLNIARGVDEEVGYRLSTPCWRVVPGILCK